MPNLRLNSTLKDTQSYVQITCSVNTLRSALLSSDLYSCSESTLLIHSSIVEHEFRYSSRHDFCTFLDRVLGVSLGMKVWNHYPIRGGLRLVN